MEFILRRGLAQYFTPVVCRSRFYRALVQKIYQELVLIEEREKKEAFLESAQILKCDQVSMIRDFVPLFSPRKHKSARLRVIVYPYICSGNLECYFYRGRLNGRFFVKRIRQCKRGESCGCYKFIQCFSFHTMYCSNGCECKDKT